MLLSQSVKPISYVKTHASKIINDISENHQSVVITQNGEAKAIIEDLREYEKTQEALAMLKIIALGKADIDQGHTKPVKRVFADVRKQIERTKRERDNV